MVTSICSMPITSSSWNSNSNFFSLVTFPFVTFLYEIFFLSFTNLSSFNLPVYICYGFIVGFSMSQPSMQVSKKKKTRVNRTSSSPWRKLCLTLTLDMSADVYIAIYTLRHSSYDTQDQCLVKNEFLTENVQLSWYYVKKVYFQISKHNVTQIVIGQMMELVIKLIFSITASTLPGSSAVIVLVCKYTLYVKSVSTYKFAVKKLMYKRNSFIIVAQSRFKVLQTKTEIFWSKLFAGPNKSCWIGWNHLVFQPAVRVK